MATVVGQVSTAVRRAPSSNPGRGAAVAQLLRRACLAAALLLTSTPGWAGEVILLETQALAEASTIADAVAARLAEHTVTRRKLPPDASQAASTVQGIPAGAVIVAVGPGAATAARTHAPSFPLVYCLVPDPAALGLSAAPNVHGVLYAVPVRNQLAAFRSVSPRINRIGVVYSRDEASALIAEAERAAVPLRIIIVPSSIVNESDVGPAAAKLLKDVDALWIPNDKVVLGASAAALISAKKAAKPVLSSLAGLVPEGALASYDWGAGAVSEVVAKLVGQVLRGEPNIERLAVPRAELVVNREQAKELAIPVP